MDIRPLAFYKPAEELRDFLANHAAFSNIKDRRGLVPIAAIDDQPFAPEASLRSYGYNINQIGDIKTIEEIAEYSIVLCDVMGVGAHFKSAAQGGNLIKEIKSNFPATIVVAYTGASLATIPARTAEQNADHLIKKDADNAEWVDALDGLIDDAVHPYHIWARIRQNLIANNVSTKDLLKIEDAYVRSILDQDAEFGKLVSLLGNLELKQTSKTIVTNLVSSAIFGLLFG